MLMTAVLIDEHVHEKVINDRIAPKIPSGKDKRLIVLFWSWHLYIILQPLIDVKDCTHYCGAHVQVKTIMETSCEVVLS